MRPRAPLARRRRRHIPTLWATRDVAAALGRTPPTITREVSTGRLPAPDGRLGNTPWWWPATIARWARQHGVALHEGPPVESPLRPVDPARSLAALHPELAADWHPIRNTYGPTHVGASATRQVWWQCRRCGHEWQAWVHNRSRGAGCPVCGRRKRPDRGRSLADLRPDLAALWHPSLNGDLTAADVSLGSGVQVWWRCPRCGHEWRHTPNQRRHARRDCPACEPPAAQD